MQKRVFISPKKYIQGDGILSTIGEEVAKIGSKALVLSDENVWNITGETTEKSLKDANIDFHYEAFSGESSNNEIERLSNVGKENSSDVVIAVGGGNTIETVKAVSDAICVPVIIAPTTTSSHPQTRALSVNYFVNVIFECYKFYDKIPDLVLVDSKVIVGAPILLFASGMGDAMATLVESRASRKRNSVTMAGGKATLAAEAIAEKAEQTLFEQGPAA